MIVLRRPLLVAVGVLVLAVMAGCEQAAAEHEGNGSNGLRQAEVEAKVALQG
jgi:hypothetical protein